MTRRAKIRIVFGFVVFASLLAAIAIHIVRSPGFANYVRAKIIAVTEESTGGRVEVGHFQFDWRNLQATIYDFVLHGTEGPSDAPLFSARKIDVRLKLLSGWRKAIDVRYLGLDQPSANVIVYPDGRTNLPEPRIAGKPGRNGLGTVVDLAIGNFQVSDGSVTFANRKIDWSGRGETLQAQLFYRPAESSYQGRVTIAALRLASGNRPPVDASLDLPIRIGKDRVHLDNASLATARSQIHLTAAISRFEHPVIDAHLVAHIALTEVQRGAGLEMDPCTSATPCFADADVQARVDQQSVEVSNAKIVAGRTHFEASGARSSVEFRGSVDVNEVARLLRVSSPPDGEIALSGEAKDLGTSRYRLAGRIVGDHLSVPTTLKGSAGFSLSSDLAADHDGVDLRNLRVGLLGGEIEGNVSLKGLSDFQFNTRLRSLQLADVERTMSRANPPYSGSLNGTLQASAKLQTGLRSVRARADLAILPGPDGIPVSGKLGMSYDGARNSVDVTQSYLALPHSRMNLAGTLGVRTVIDLSSTSLDDLYPALAMSSASKNLPELLPGGKLIAHVEVTGPLSSPTLAAHIDAARFAVAHRPFDALGADLTASQSGASISNVALTRQSLRVQLAGSLGLRNWSASDDSPIALTFTFQNGDLSDVLALAGQPGIPARGAVEMSAQISGTLGNPQGTARLSATVGALYNQPFDTAEGDVELSDQLIRLTSLDIKAEAANLHATGTYTHPRDSLLSGHADLVVSGNGVQLSQVPALTGRRAGLNGSIRLNAAVAGDVIDSPSGSGFKLTRIRADLDAHDLRDDKQSYGDLTLRADTSGSNVTFNLDSNLGAASAKVAGRIALAAEYPITADLWVQNLRVEKAVALAGQSFPASGSVTVTAHFSGPLLDPSGTAQINLADAKLYDESVTSLQANLRYSSTSAEISSLSVTAPAGQITARGVFSHPDRRFDTGTFDLHVQSDAIRLANVGQIASRKAGVAGIASITADLAGELKSRAISLSKVNARLAATQIAYNGRTYGNATLSADTKGAEVALKADSNFAGASIHGEGTAGLGGDFPLTATFTLANARYSNLRDWFGDDSVQPGFEALLDANGSLTGPVKDPERMQGKLAITRLELSAPPRTRNQAPLALKNDGAMSLELDRGSVKIQNAHLAGKATDVAISGAVAFRNASPLNLTVKANTNLDLLQDIERDIHATGSISIDAVVRGKFSQPLANGTVQLKKASINIESLPNGISNANGVIVLNGSSANVRNLTAESGGGKLTLSGFAMLTGSTVRYSLHANAAHVRTRYQGISVVNSGSLTLGGTSGKSLLSGSVTVERVVYNAQSDIGSMLSQLTQSAAPNVSEESGALAATRLDIRVRTATDVRFETTMAQTLQADADLTLGGTLRQPGMVGRINVTQGDLIFFGNEYTVERGLIAFYDPTSIDPHISIDLETTVESIVVTLGVTGPMNNLKLSYHSDPPLQFEEIVGLLTSGKRPSSDPNIVAAQAAPPQQSVAEMGESAIVSQAVASPLSSRLQRVFGVNQLRIDPTFAGGSALPQARLTLQQRVANTVTFTYTQDLSQSNSELVRVEWALNPKFSVVATRDENGIFGVDFFYRRQFR